MREAKERARGCGNSCAPKCPYVCEDTDIVPCRALVAAFGACFALMTLWEVVASWM